VSAEAVKTEGGDDAGAESLETLGHVQSLAIETKPSVIHSNRAALTEKGIASRKHEGKFPGETEHHQIKYHNNVIEADHDKLKRRIKLTP
jgi:transposase-like protein